MRYCWLWLALLVMGAAHGTGQTLANVEYARVNGASLLLDLYLPAEDGARHPVVLWIHGGYWAGGSKDDCLAQVLTDYGYAVASINYRLSAQATFPAQIYDCKAAVRWLRAHATDYRLHPDRIGAWGESAGGHLAALLGTSGGVAALEGKGGNPRYSSRVQCVCDWYGPANLVPALSASARNPMGVQAVQRLLGGTDRAKAKLASPISYVSKDDPPFLIMHGDADSLVPVTQSRQLHAVLRKMGVASKLVIMPGADHGSAAFTESAALHTVLAFFNQHLKSGK